MRLAHKRDFDDSHNRKRDSKVLVEGIAQSNERRRNWRNMNDEELVAYAKKFMEDTKTEGRSELKRVDSGLHMILYKRKLLHKVGFRIKKREWPTMEDDELIIYTQRFIDNKKIKSRVELQRTDGGLYQVLRKRKLINKIRFENERGWKWYNNKQLLDHAQKFIESKMIRKRKHLAKIDVGLYHVLLRRKLLDKIKFKERKRQQRAAYFFTKMTDEELVHFARKLVQEKQIKCRTALIKEGGGLYNALAKRKLVDKIEFKVDERRWSKYGDEELIAYTKRFISENGIKTRSGLPERNTGLYSALCKRKLLDRAFSDLERQNNLAGLQEIVQALEQFQGEAA